MQELFLRKEKAYRCVLIFKDTLYSVAMVSRLVQLYRASAYGLPLEGFALAYPIV